MDEREVTEYHVQGMPRSGIDSRLFWSISRYADNPEQHVTTCESTNLNAIDDVSSDLESQTD